MENKNKELHRLNGVYRRLLEGAKVHYYEGRGVLVDPHTVEVDGKRVTVRYRHLRCCLPPTLKLSRSCVG